MTQKANLDLHIERLILHDLPYSQRGRVAAAIEAELTRLLAEQGIPEGWSGDMPPFDAGAVHVSAHQSAEGIGRQVAETVYARLAGAVLAENRSQNSGVSVSPSGKQRQAATSIPPADAAGDPAVRR